MILMGLVTWTLRAQVTDDFSDGDFTSDPPWFGDVSNYKVENGMLNSDGPRATSSIYLSTESEVINAE